MRLKDNNDMSTIRAATWQITSSYSNPTTKEVRDYKNRRLSVHGNTTEYTPKNNIRKQSSRNSITRKLTSNPTCDIFNPFEVRLY